MITPHVRYETCMRSFYINNIRTGRIIRYGIAESTKSKW